MLAIGVSGRRKTPF